MFVKYLFCLYVLSTASTAPTNPPVHEDVNEDITLSDTVVRIPRHPKHKYEPPNFDYGVITQQDPQRIRYAQQQEVDSYLQAYRFGQQSQRNSKPRKIETATIVVIPKAHHGSKYNDQIVGNEQNGDAMTLNSNNYRQVEQETPLKDVYHNIQQGYHIKELHSNMYPVKVQARKVVDSKHNRWLNGQKGETPKQQIHSYPSVVQEKKVVESKSQSEKVVDQSDTDDQEPQATNVHEANIYLDQQELLKRLQSSSNLPANYLTKPTYVLANPQHANLLKQGLQYAINSPNVNYGDFEPATTSDLDALNALLGKGPNIQLQGLTDLLQHQQVQHQIPEIQLPITEKVQQPQLPTAQALTQAQTQSHAQVQTQVRVQPQAHVKPQWYVKPQSQVQKDYTPIKEEVRDVSNRNVKPNVQTAAPVQQYQRQQIKKSYGDNENLQYAAQYAFGYKVRDYHSGSNFGHEEIREGDDVKGHYHVVLPDGRLQNVEYWADPSGYHAKVTYTQVEQH